MQKCTGNEKSRKSGERRKEMRKRIEEKKENGRLTRQGVARTVIWRVFKSSLVFQQKEKEKEKKEERQGKKVEKNGG